MTKGEKQRTYNLEERTAKFGEDVIDWIKKIPKNDLTQRLISQLIGCSTSVGANYCEADCAESNKDFIHKMSIANKESKESKHFIRMLSRIYPKETTQGRILWKEADELNRIFTTIIKNAKDTEEKNKIDKKLDI